jgi:hypothetical protein
MNQTNSSFSGLCATTIVAFSFALVGPAGCGSSASAPSVDAAGEISPAAVDAGVDSVAIDAQTVVDAPTCPASCDDTNDCTIDSCDPNTFQCVHTWVADGTSCEDGNACSINDVCQGGLCYSGPYRSCAAIDQCHIAGVCTPKTGKCSNPNSPAGTPCDDGNTCTVGDQCLEGVCAGAVRVCPGQNVCDEATGVCRNPSGLPVFPTAISEFVFENAYGPVHGNGLARSPDGSVFAAGSFQDNSDLGSGPVNTSDPRGANNTDVFLARLDPSTGKAIWTQTFGDAMKQDVTSFAVNGGGQIGIVGPLQGEWTVGTMDLERVLKGDYYVLGASVTDGTGQWARRVNLGGNGSLRAIAGDPNASRFVLCGTTTNAATDLSAALVWQGGEDIVLASLVAGIGDTGWAQQIGGINDEECQAVAIDGHSNIYLVGSYRFGSTVAIGGLPPLPMVDQTGTAQWLFVAKLDSAGNALWSRYYGQGQQVQTASAVMPAATASGGDGLVLAGTVTGTSSFAGVTVDSGSFVAMLDGSKGDVLWVRSLGTGGGASVTSFSANSVGNIVVAGNYGDALTLGGTVLPRPYNVAGAFVALLDATGNFLAAIGYGDPQYSNQAVGVMTNPTGSGVDKDATLFLASFRTQMELGQPVGTLVASSPQQAIAALKLAP